MTNNTLKAVVALFALHSLLLLLLRLNQGVSAYAAGQLSAKLLFLVIVAIALLRVLKHGWGVSLFLLVGTLVSETRLLIGTLASPAVGGPVTTTWVLFLVVNLPLLAAIALLFKRSSREPFIARFGKGSRAAA